MALSNGQFDESLDELINLLSRYLDNLQTIEKRRCNGCQFIYLVFSNQKEHIIEATISYNDSYCTPVIHFRPLSVPKETKIVDQDDDMAFEVTPSPNFSAQNLRENIINHQFVAVFDMGNVTLVDHALLNTTWFLVHPCESLNYMTQVYDNYPDKTPINFICCWLSTYGRVIGLNLDSGVLLGG